MSLLYEYKEFEEVDMKLEKLVEVDVYDAVAKGEKRGEKRGLRRGIFQTARSMLTEGLDPILVARITKLPEKQVMALR